ncbi:MAG: radical SAM protein, partial [Endomicrobiaceae bacterium]|nr:radical SAM protein [Endomicrobiaceae bacterium]
MAMDDIYSKLKSIVSSHCSDYDDSDALEFIKKLNYNKDERLVKIANELLLIDFNNEDVMNIKIKNRVLSELETFQSKSVLESKPRDLQVVLTNKCNLNCKMCANDKIDWDLKERTLNSIKNNMKYFERILWQGGEAFLYPDFLGLLELAHENKVIQSIMTNGLLIDEKTADVITKTDTDIVISIDSVNPTVYEDIRIGAKFEQLLNSLELLYKYKGINNSKTSFDMATIIMHSTCRELFDFIDFAEKYHFRSICLNQLGINDKDQSESLPQEDVDFLRSNKIKLLTRMKN